jgi:hypothetical protein
VQEGKQIMITLFRMFRCWQLRTKWQLAIWQFIDKQAMKLIKNPEELEKKFMDSLAKVIHESNKNNLDK